MLKRPDKDELSDLRRLGGPGGERIVGWLKASLAQVREDNDSALDHEIGWNQGSAQTLQDLLTFITESGGSGEG